jgi:hypothetical protein
MDLLAEKDTMDCVALDEILGSASTTPDAGKIESIRQEIAQYYTSHTSTVEREMVRCDAMLEHLGIFESAVRDSIKVLETDDIDETGLLIRPVFKTIRMPMPWFYGRLSGMSESQLTEIFTIPRELLIAEATRMLNWPIDLPTTNITKFFVEPKPADRFDASRYEEHIRAKMRLCYMGNVERMKIYKPGKDLSIIQQMYEYMEKNRSIRHTRNYRDKTDTNPDITSYTMGLFIISECPRVPENIEAVIQDIATRLAIAFLTLKSHSYLTLTQPNSSGGKLISIIESAGPEIKMHLYGLI